MSVDQGELKILMRDALESLAGDKAKLAVEAIVIDLKNRLSSWTEEPFDKREKEKREFDLDDENMKEFWEAIVRESFIERKEK